MGVPSAFGVLWTASFCSLRREALAFCLLFLCSCGVESTCAVTVSRDGTVRCRKKGWKNEQMGKRKALTRGPLFQRKRQKQKRTHWEEEHARIEAEDREKCIEKQAFANLSGGNLSLIAESNSWFFNSHQDHIAEKGYSSVYHSGMVYTPIPMTQAIKIQRMGNIKEPSSLGCLESS